MNSLLKERLEEIYERHHNRQAVDPDPLLFLYPYRDVRDREVVSLIASSLAYGRVLQILKSVSTVLGRMNPSPANFLVYSSTKEIISTFKDFRHRFTSGADMAYLLCGAKKIMEEYGSLYRAFTMNLKRDHETVLNALTGFVKAFFRFIPQKENSLLPRPERGSACKRWNLFLRWMVRKDEVDPGGWEKIPTAKLIVPLDTHMHRIGLGLRFTERKQADMKAAMEITAAFRLIAPDDPVRYDFSLTRLGIQGDGNLGRFLDLCKGVN
jgi:uncharacterized protein (TIGR02757 family)